jgi:hypothetical protein
VVQPDSMADDLNGEPMAIAGGGRLHPAPFQPARTRLTVTAAMVASAPATTVSGEAPLATAPRVLRFPYNRLHAMCDRSSV